MTHDASWVASACARPQPQRSARLATALLAILLCLAGFQGAAAQANADTKPVARTAPSWLDTAVIYEIYPRDFSPAGTLDGVTARLDSLQELGVNVLWVMPVHPIGKEHRLGTYGSPYAARDYYAIDPALGSQTDMRTLVQAAHARHMRVILDIAANHTSWDSVMMKHPEFYHHDAEGHILSPHDWSDVAWLDYSNPGLRQYMLQMFAWWVKTFDLDGFRCDDAADVPTDFWDQVRDELAPLQPDLLMLAEASKPELLRHAFDIDYAWPLLSTLDRVLLEGVPASAIQASLTEEGKRFPSGAWHMLISDDHDTERATVRFGAPAALAASALVFTLPGAPMLYNGMEAGDASPSAAPALFDKVPVYWDAAKLRPIFPAFYRALIALRKSSPALKDGELVWVHNSDEAHVVSFLRRSPEQTVLVAINLSDVPFTGSVEPGGKDWQEVSLSSKKLPLNSLPVLSLEPFGIRVFSQR